MIVLFWQRIGMNRYHWNSWKLNDGCLNLNCNSMTHTRAIKISVPSVHNREALALVAVRWKEIKLKMSFCVITEYLPNN